MKLAILSGKGGTGKTTIATNFALSLKKAQLIDCDVEEPNASLFLDVEFNQKISVTVPVPVFDDEKCTYCKQCAEACQFNALAVLPENLLFFKELCHGCGACRIVCEQEAISEDVREIGVIESGSVGNLQFYQGVLNVGEPMATPIIRALKDLISNHLPVILDAPPGTGCPVIETVSDCDYGILVTEPTPFGLHDLKLAVAVMRKLEKPFGVIINRDGIGNSGVEDYCNIDGIEVLLKVPQSMEIARLYSQGIPFIRHMPVWKDRFVELYDYLENLQERS